MTTNSEYLFSGGGGGGAAEYQIERSVRFNSSDSGHLSRVPSSTSATTTWTWSAWVKRATLGGKGLFGAYYGNQSRYFLIRFNSSDQIDIYGGNYSTSSSTTTNVYLITTSLYRDTSAWMHVVFTYDTANGTSSDRARLYVNGNRVTDFSTEIYPGSSSSTFVNYNTATHYTGAWWTGSEFFDGYLADIHFIDSQALDPTSFGEFDTNGVWQPKAYSGGYGTNGFHLPFSDNSTSAALGTDTSGNGNTWTVNNISVAAGAGNDSLVDTPTNYGTDTGAGGEVRGNYATLNPLVVNANSGQVTFSNGNLNLVYSSTATYSSTIATIGVSSGKWYWEVTQTASSQNSNIGVVRDGDSLANYVGQTANGYSYYGGAGNKYNNAIGVSYGASFAANDVIGVALDMDAGTITFYKNGVSQGQAYSGLSGLFYPAVSDGNSSATVAFVVNFGQRPFAYTAPSGFKALCTQNLPDPTIADGSTAMDVALYTGNGSTQTISGLGFSPDFVWLKTRSTAGSYDYHWLFDTIRGVNKGLSSNATLVEQSFTDTLTSFDSTGFTVGSNMNQNTVPYAAWTWDAGSSTVTNNDGSITSQVRANPSAGFSIVTYSGNGVVGSTIGHGLNAVPSMLIVKPRTGVTTYGWRVYHASTGNTKYLNLNSSAAAATYTDWNSTTPTSSVFSVDGTTAGTVNVSGSTYVAYCFAPVEGYSAFGSYTGNGSADGPFVYTGFRPRWIMFKRTDATQNWTIIDTSRDTYNIMNRRLFANLSYAEDQGIPNFIDITANGFKCRDSNISYNASGGTYIYAAFAENPFKTSRAR